MDQDWCRGYESRHCDAPHRQESGRCGRNDGAHHLESAQSARAGLALPRMLLVVVEFAVDVRLV
jgi:hypothetical protein